MSGWRLSALLLAAVALAALADSECPLAPATPQDRRSDPNRLRVVQFNAEWLFIDPYSNCPGTGCPWANQDAAWTHLQSIASVIQELNPDIVNFCEVEGCNELNDVIDELGPGSNYVAYLKKGTDTATGQNVGIITRVDPIENLWRSSETVPYPVAGSSCGAASTGNKGCSKHYFTSFEVHGMRIAMIGAHLLAYPDDIYRCLEREAQATVLRHVIEDYMEDGYEVIVLGDFNDFDNNPKDKNDNTAISQVLEILKGTGTQHELTNVASILDKSQRYSDWWDEDNDCLYGDDEVSLIDHVLLSPKLVGYIDQVFVAHNAWQQTCDTTYSDHWPVVVDFVFERPDDNDDDKKDDDDDDDQALSTTGMWLIIGAGMLVFLAGTIYSAQRFLVIRKKRREDQNVSKYAQMDD